MDSGFIRVRHQWSLIRIWWTRYFDLHPLLMVFLNWKLDFENGSPCVYQAYNLFAHTYKYVRFTREMTRTKELSLAQDQVKYKSELTYHHKSPLFYCLTSSVLTQRATVRLINHYLSRRTLRTNQPSKLMNLLSDYESYESIFVYIHYSLLYAKPVGNIFENQYQS